MAFDERDRQHGLEPDVDEEREASGENEQQERDVAADHPERFPLRRLVGRIGAPPRQQAGPEQDRGEQQRPRAD